MTTSLVGRGTEIAKLTSFAEAVIDSQGRLLLLQGPPGYGKTLLLREFLDGLPALTPGLWSALTRCSRDLGLRDSYGPIKRLVQAVPANPGVFESAEGAQRRSDLQFAPVLDELVRTSGSFVRSRSEGRTSQERRRRFGRSEADVLHGYIKMILALAEDQPVILAIDDAQYLDADSARVLSGLIKSLVDAPVGVVLASHLAMPPTRPCAALIQDVGESRLLRNIVLPPFGEAECAALFSRHWGRPPSGRELMEILGPTHGEPFSVSMAVEAVEQLGVDSVPVPAVTRRNSRDYQIIRALQKSSPLQQQLLETAATEADFFLSAVLARVSGVPKDVVHRELHGINDKLIELPENQPLWVTRAHSDFYQFSHSFVQELLYRKPSPEQRRENHRRFAMALEEIEGQVDHPVSLHLAILRHYREAREARRAAGGSLEVARHLALYGSSIDEVYSTCEEGLRDLDSVEMTPADQSVKAQLLELALAVTELRWTGLPEDEEPEKLEERCDRALEAAEKSGNAELITRMLLMKGRVRLHTRGLHDAITHLRRAYDLATTSGDTVTRFIAAVEYGRQLGKDQLRAGIAVLEEAEQIQASNRIVRDSQDPVILRARHLNVLQLGVNILDDGRPGEALRKLQDAANDARKAHVGLFAIGSNYLAQAFSAVGDLAAAKKVLKAATEEAGDTESGDAWHANNLAHLGHLLVMNEHGRDGLRLLEQAARETKRSQLANLTSLVFNLRNEALMELDEDSADEDLVATLLEECLQDARRRQMARSEIKALSLMARFHLKHGRNSHARSRSNEAIKILEQKNMRQPALRTEDILLQHAEILHALGDRGARKVIRRALREVEDKKATLSADQLSFWDQERINRRVLRLHLQLCG